MKPNYLTILYPFGLLVSYAIIMYAEYMQTSCTVINFTMVIHTFASFLFVALFMAIALWMSQFIGKLILFDHPGPRKPQTFVLLIFSRYVLYLGFLQYLLINMLPQQDGFHAMQIIIYNIFAGLMLIDFTIYWLELKQDDLVTIRIFRWHFDILIVQVYRLQVYIVAVLTLILLSRYSVTCNIGFGYQYHMPLSVHEFAEW